MEEKRLTLEEETALLTRIYKERKMNTTLTEREIDELKISLLEAAKKKLIRALKDLDIEGLTIHERGGQGRKSRYNDRRMVIWIRCEYEGREYWITLFESEIDPESGNCHTQYGKIMFVKDLVKNYSSMSSPNQICDRTGESVFLRFESGKWKTPFPFGDREYVTAGDVMENDTLADEIAEAFAGFVKEQEDGV